MGVKKGMYINIRVFLFKETWVSKSGINIKLTFFLPMFVRKDNFRLPRW